VPSAACDVATDLIFSSLLQGARPTRSTSSADIESAEPEVILPQNAPPPAFSRGHGRKSKP
jgi:hypothetical protein